MALADLQLLVDDLVRDGGERLDAPARDRAIGLAVAQLGKDRPRLLPVDLAGVGSAARPLPPECRRPDQVVAVEWPADAGERLPTRAWSVGRVPGGLELRLARDVPGTAEVRVLLKAGHVLDEVQDTIDPDDREAVASYAAAVLLDQLAAATAGETEGTLQADAVNHGGKSANYAARARRLRERYHQLLGVDPGRVAPASATANLSLADTRGRDRLLWPRRFR